MIGLVAVRTPDGVPWPGGDTQTFDRDDVVAFGKVRVWGDFCTRYLVRLSDGTEVFVNASEQGDDERWLRREARLLGGHGSVPRGGYALRWREVTR